MDLLTLQTELEELGYTVFLEKTVSEWDGGVKVPEYATLIYVDLTSPWWVCPWHSHRLKVRYAFSGRTAATIWPNLAHVLHPEQDMRDILALARRAAEAAKKTVETRYMYRVVNGYEVGGSYKGEDSVPAGRFLTPSLAKAMRIINHNCALVFEAEGAHGDFSKILVLRRDDSSVRDPLPREKIGNASFDEGEKVTTAPMRIVAVLHPERLTRLSGPELNVLDPLEL